MRDHGHCDTVLAYPKHFGPAGVAAHTHTHTHTRAYPEDFGHLG